VGKPLHTYRSSRYSRLEGCSRANFGRERWHKKRVTRIRRKGLSSSFCWRQEFPCVLPHLVFSSRSS
jgi:hypothetical protein